MASNISVIFELPMPLEKKISALYLDHKNSFSKHLKAAKKLEEKDVHKLRVQIKNLRVLFRFLESLPHEKFKSASFLTLLDPVFKKAGEIRTQHLNLTLTASYRSALMLRFKNHLREKEKKAGKALVKEIKHFDKETFKKLHKKNLKSLKKLNPEVTHKESEKYIRAIFAKLHKNLFDVDNDEVLHKIRKRLKTIKNMNHLLSEIVPSSTLSAEIKKMEKIYEGLGEWHDGLVLAETFENYVRKKETPDTAEQATKILLKLLEKTEKNKFSIMKRMRVDLV